MTLRQTRPGEHPIVPTGGELLPRQQANHDVETLDAHGNAPPPHPNAHAPRAQRPAPDSMPGAVISSQTPAPQKPE